ncbi:hypothetical protein JCM5350_005989 [Sporobolomyces pararoseus]
MPLSADVNLRDTSFRTAVELYWELLVDYRREEKSGSPHDDLVIWPSQKHVEDTARELPEQIGRYRVNRVVVVAGAAGRVLWRPDLSSGSNFITPKGRSKLGIYSRVKLRGSGNDQLWRNALNLQSRPQIYINDARTIYLATHAALPRQLPVAPNPTKAKPGWREGFFNTHGRYSVKNELLDIELVFTVLQRGIPPLLYDKINPDDRPDGSPSCTDQTDIKLELKPIGNRDPSDSFSCVFQVKIMQRNTGEWIPWVPEDMYIKPEPGTPEPRIKREPRSRSPRRRSRSPSAGPSNRTSRIKQEPHYSLTHRKGAIYGQSEAGGGLQRF